MHDVTSGVTPIRDTSAQDRVIDNAPLRSRRRYLIIGAAVCGALLLLVLVMVIRTQCEEARS